MTAVDPLEVRVAVLEANHLSLDKSLTAVVDELKSLRTTLVCGIGGGLLFGMIQIVSR